MTNIADYDLQDRFGCVVHANFSVLQRLQVGKNSTLWLSEIVRIELFITSEETLSYIMSKTSAHRSCNVNHIVAYHSNDQPRPRISQSF